LVPAPEPLELGPVEVVDPAPLPLVSDGPVVTPPWSDGGVGLGGVFGFVAGAEGVDGVVPEPVGVVAVGVVPVRVGVVGLAVTGAAPPVRVGAVGLAVTGAAPPVRLGAVGLPMTGAPP
jgi:hypothetical protein